MPSSVSDLLKNIMDEVSESDDDRLKRIMDSPHEVSDINDDNNNCRQLTDSSSSSSREQRQCWVCLETDEDDPKAEWTQPCKCKGATKWVHQRCIQCWIDEKQAGRGAPLVACPQCKSIYVMNYPRLNWFLFVLDVIDRILCELSPSIAAAIALTLLYCCALIYGMLTVIQVFGYEEGLRTLQAMSKPVLFLELPVGLPVILLSFKLFDWDAKCLRLWLYCSLPEGVSVSQVYPKERLMDSPHFDDGTNALRLLCSTLLFPTISVLLGYLLFPNIESGLIRTLLAAIVFSIVKGVLKIYLRKEQYLSRAKRKVMDLQSENSSTPPDLGRSGVDLV